MITPTTFLQSLNRPKLLVRAAQVWLPEFNRERSMRRIFPGMVPPAPQSPVERQAADYALPKATGQKWRQVRMVDLEELETATLPIDADGAVKVDVTKKRIVTLEFLP